MAFIANKFSQGATMKKSVLIILAPGFEEIEALTPIDMLRRAGVSVTVAGINSTEITGAHDITVKCDKEISELIHHPFDGVILPGGNPGTPNLLESDAVLEIVNRSHKDNKVIAAICAAPMVLDKATVLTNKKFTCYPGTEKNIKHGTFSNEKVIIDGNLVTARSLADSIDFSLAVISQLTPEYDCEILKKQIVY